MGRTSRAVIPGSRLFKILFGLPRSGRNIAGLFWREPKRLPSRRFPPLHRSNTPFLHRSADVTHGSDTQVAGNGPEGILQLMEPGGTELAAGKPGDYANESLVPAFLFDLDGTLVDSVYQHVLAWREALEKAGIELSVWRIHRRIGMSGGLFINALLRETGGRIDSEKADELRRLHAEAYNRQSKTVRPLPGARELLRHLAALKVPHAIATSGRLETAGPNLEMLGLAPGTPVVTRDLVRYAKPDPHLFLEAAAQLGVPITNSIVIGDSVWDMLAARRARALGVGLLSGGYGSDELERAGAYRVYQDPADLLAHLDEVGVRP
jgi:HAD superfamily hydrolase (TIGR01509 family)